MGLTKRLMEEDEHLRDVAIGICCEAGALSTCEYHDGDLFNGNEEVEGAYKLANNKITNLKLVLPNRITRKDFTDIIKDVYDDNSYAGKCPSCERIKERG